MSQGSSFKEKAIDLLNQFECIIESDDYIDEVGFIHSSQFATLNKEAGISLRSSDGCELQLEDGTSSADEIANFWHRDHKLGISTEILLPLYKVARNAFMCALRQYETPRKSSVESGDENIVRHISSSCDTLEREVMKHSKALLLLSSDFGTAWNARKLLVSRKEHFSVFMDELALSALVLSYSPKSEQAWCHRRWVIKMIAGKCLSMHEVLRKESELVEKMAERSKMNYRAWNHRCWLVSYMAREQLLHELNKSRHWAGLHIADNSCFHYRRLLMLKILEHYFNEQGDESSGYISETYQVWKKEIDWNEELIKHYVGREALWLHRRFLSLYWMRHFACDHGLSTHIKQQTSTDNHIRCFMDNELLLLNSCSIIPDSEFEDFQTQASHAASYILWLSKQIPKCKQIVQEKLASGNLKILLNKACPDRSFLWDHLDSMEVSHNL